MGAVTVVFDTNVIVSAAGFGGVPERCLVRSFEDDIHVVTSQEALDELERVLQYERLPFDEDARDDIPWAFRHLTGATVIEPDVSLDVFDDSDDDRFIECAVEANAEYLVSGDERHVQTVDSFRGVSIVSPREFLAAVGDGE
jgi:putative PIN family toxin of toxin-antitoxin system